MSRKTQNQPRIALVGNPNTGKTTLFNLLTGLSQRTGNFPGCTVEKKTGTLQLANTTTEVIDLPGTYSLAALSPDELVVSETLLHLRPEEKAVDAVLVVVDAACLHRNLYLVHQLRELEMPMVVALNMVDQADTRGIRIDAQALSEKLGLPVVPTNAGSGMGIADLKTALGQALDNPTHAEGRNLFPEITKAAGGLVADLQVDSELRRSLQHLTFRALIDEEGTAAERLEAWGGGHFSQKIRTEASQLKAEMGRLIDHETRTRYNWIREMLDDIQTNQADQPTTFSEKLDKILTHPILGVLTLFVVLAVVFQSIYTWAGPVMDLVEGSVGALGDLIGGGMADGMFKSLVVDGVIGGVGGVLVFLPQIVFLFAFLAILEDCGYMARAAFLMDRIFKSFGLSGKSLIPMLSSFACAIPGMMSTRTIEDRRERFAAIFVSPFMSCSARLPVYVIMIAAFIPANEKVLGFFTMQGLTLFLMYCVGVVVAIPTAWLMKRTVLKGVTTPFLMELPSYKVPDFRSVGLRVYQAGREFILRAGTTILALSIVVWALCYFPRSESVAEKFAQDINRAEGVYVEILRSIVAEESPESDAGAMDIKALEAQVDELGEDVIAKKDEARSELANLENKMDSEYLSTSYLGRMGKKIEPIVEPLGWDWRIGVGALASFPAREVIVSTMNIIFGLGGEVEEAAEGEESKLQAALVNQYGDKNVPLALSIMVFFALCAQCAATLAVMKKETGSWRYPIFSFCYMTGLAYVAAFLVFQGATALA